MSETMWTIKTAKWIRLGDGTLFPLDKVIKITKKVVVLVEQEAIKINEEDYNFLCNYLMEAK